MIGAEVVADASSKSRGVSGVLGRARLSFPQRTCGLKGGGHRSHGQRPGNRTIHTVPSPNGAAFISPGQRPGNSTSTRFIRPERARHETGTPPRRDLEQTIARNVAEIRRSCWKRWPPWMAPARVPPFQGGEGWCGPGSQGVPLGWRVVAPLARRRDDAARPLGQPGIAESQPSAQPNRLQLVSPGRCSRLPWFRPSARGVPRNPQDDAGNRSQEFRHRMRLFWRHGTDRVRVRGRGPGRGHSAAGD